jgi:hypothetical protein
MPYASRQDPYAKLTRDERSGLEEELARVNAMQPETDGQERALENRAFELSYQLSHEGRLPPEYEEFYGY